MSTQRLRAYFDTARSAHDYLYLLVNPHAGCHEGHQLSMPELEKTLGARVITVVSRPGFARASHMCPRLVTLSEPGQPIPDGPLAASLTYAAEASPGGKRYVCGWILSTSDAGSLARHLTTLSLAIEGTHRRVWPLFEPLRMELLAISMREEIGAWLGPVSESVIPSSSGGLFRLRGARGARPIEPSAEALAAQQSAPAVAAVLAAWQRVVSKRSHHDSTSSRAGQTLPAGAAAKAHIHLREARARGLPAGEDQLVFALHCLTAHPCWHTHPQLSAYVAQAVASKTRLADALLCIDERTWRRVIQDLATVQHH